MERGGTDIWNGHLLRSNRTGREQRSSGCTGITEGGGPPPSPSPNATTVWDGDPLSAFFTVLDICFMIFMFFHNFEICCSKEKARAGMVGLFVYDFYDFL